MALLGAAPAGEWELSFGPDALPIFASGQLDDIVLVVGWRGKGPLWT
jgi:hypothetical protein